MILITPGVVLARRPYREYERFVSVYTKVLGKVPARFAGVDRPKGKLKALSEPMVHAEYRLYQRPGSAWWTVTGGQIITSFPDTRSHLDRTLGGLEICELLMQLTPDHSPNTRKYDLIVECLEALEKNPSPWLPISFGLRLLQLAGLGPDASRISAEDIGFWKSLQELSPQELVFLPKDADRFRRLRSAFERQVEIHMEAPLKSRLFRESMSSLSFRREKVGAGA